MCWRTEEVRPRVVLQRHSHFVGFFYGARPFLTVIRCNRQFQSPFYDAHGDTADIFSSLTSGSPGLQKYCETAYSRSRISQMWIIKISKELSKQLKSPIFNYVQPSSLDFSTLHTTIATMLYVTASCMP